MMWALSIGALGFFEYVQDGGSTHYFVDTTKVAVPQTENANRSGRSLSFEDFVGYRAEHYFSFSRLVAAMLVPIIAIWCIVYIGVFVVRWVAVGFKRKGT